MLQEVILYGHWERNYEILNVSFVNEGTTIKTIKVENGAVITDKPVDPKKTGYNFLGWTAQGEEELFDFDTKITSDLKDEEKHLIRLVVELLSDAKAKEVLLKAARERGFKDATETNSLLFEAHLLLDEEITELDGSMILTLRLPPAMCNVPSGYNREFRVLHRLSDGTIKEEQIVSLDLNNRIIKIKVDELSPFAVVFRNIAKPDEGRRSLPRTGVSSDDGSHTMKMIALVAAFSLIGTMRIKAKAGKDYWENLK